MNKQLIVLLFIFVGIISLVLVSKDVNAEEKQLPPLDPAYVGIHGMVLMSKSSTIFASHLPLYHKPHNVQLIYKLKVHDVALVQLVRDNRLVTIKPEKFNLQRLMRGESVNLKADIYLGHFERGGELIYSQVTLEFDEQLYMRELTELATSSKEKQYDMVSYNSKNDYLVVHQIQSPPSYDHIFHIDQQAGCRKSFTASSVVPKERELLAKFMFCGTIKPLYYETEDFRQSH